MFSFNYDEDVSISLPVINLDAKVLFKEIQESKNEIAPWLPWAKEMKKVEQEAEFLAVTLKHFGAGNSLNCVIFYHDQQVGMISFNKIDNVNKLADIGYWLGTRWTHKGIMHRAVLAMLEVGFTDYQLNKIIIRAAIDNQPSNLVAQKLNFHLDGINREAEKYANNKFRDLNEWSLLKSEWLANSMKRS